MCARTTLTKPKVDELAGELDAELAGDDVVLYRPRYNVAPSDLTWIVELGGDRRRLVPAIRGYLAQPRGRGKGAGGEAAPTPRPHPLINVRGEQVASGHGFRDAFASRRCVLVTDGFFEWDERRQPTWFHRPDGGLVLLAGLCQAPVLPKDTRPRFTVLTTRPNQLISAVHDRMPVIIPPAALDTWLGGAPLDAARLVAPAPEDALTATPVSTRVNSVKHDDPACLTPAEHRPAAQQSLF